MVSTVSPCVFSIGDSHRSIAADVAPLRTCTIVECVSSIIVMDYHYLVTGKLLALLTPVV